MTKDNQELYIQFLRDISAGDGSMNVLSEALQGVAYMYHVSGIEAEILGLDEADRKILTLLERQNTDPVGEPVKLIFESEMIPTIVIYVYAAETPFTDDEKEELEMYAINCGLVLQKYKIAGMI